MHVLIFPSWYPASADDVSGVFFRDQALALLNHGHKVGVVAPQMRSLRTLMGKPNKTALPYYELDSGLPTYRRAVLAALPRVPYGNYRLFRRTARMLLFAYVERHGRPDIIHAHAAVFGGAVAIELADELGIPVVLTEHSTGFARNAYAKWQLQLAGKAFAGASSLIAVSPSLCELLTHRFPRTQGRWQWIPNVVARRFETRNRPARPSRSVRFLNIGLMTEKKGQFDLLSAFHRILQDELAAELWFVGDGKIRPELEARAKALGLGEKVRFLGLVPPEDIPAIMQNVDALVISSHYETFGVVAAEALMGGLPVVATRCGGPECIVGEGDGVLVPPRQPDALARAMQSVGNKLSAYDSESLAERAKARFAGPAVAAQLTETFNKVLSEYGTPVQVE